MRVKTLYVIAMGIFIICGLNACGKKGPLKPIFDGKSQIIR